MDSYRIHPTVLESVTAARQNQIAKHGDTERDLDNNNGEWSLVSGEEYGEWCKALLQGTPDDWDKAADLAACAIAFMEARLLAAMREPVKT